MSDKAIIRMAAVVIWLWALAALVTLANQVLTLYIQWAGPLVPPVG